MKKVILGIVLALSLAAPDRAMAGEKYLIDHEVWGWYQKYLRNIGNGTRPGAFVITKDGHGAFYSWCQDTRCVAGPTYSQDALNYCKREYNTECVVFAVRDNIKVEYEIRGRASGASSSAAPPVAKPTPVVAAPAAATPPTPIASTAKPAETATPPAPVLQPKPVTKIDIAPDVRSEIDAYLHNVESTARVWAFAIAKDGSAGAMASCPAGGGWSGGGACEPVKGGAQELASREAVKRCGGADDCILLYVGRKKTADIELVSR